MKIHTALKAALLSVVLAGAVMSWGLEGFGGVYANASASASSSEAVSESQAIPSDAIRLRILANSDLEEDQAVKREVRDRVIEMMNGWLEEEAAPASREEARDMINKHMEEITAAANEVLREAGMSYKAKAELKVVPFPAKLYGGEIYPAGDYEALRLTLGEGEGQNWWCVLFPPLCFVDSGQGTAVAQDNADNTELTASGEAQDETTDSGSTDGLTDSSVDSSEGTEREVRFFIWDVLVAIGEFFSWLFTAIFG